MHPATPMPARDGDITLSAVIEHRIRELAVLVRQLRAERQQRNRTARAAHARESQGNRRARGGVK